MKALPKRKGNFHTLHDAVIVHAASMKALPKRKGNHIRHRVPLSAITGLNESPSEKEGKCIMRKLKTVLSDASMKALPKRKGNPPATTTKQNATPASMKALPKRKGNIEKLLEYVGIIHSLNESPSEKEGKSP